MIQENKSVSIYLDQSLHGYDKYHKNTEPQISWFRRVGKYIIEARYCFDKRQSIDFYCFVEKPNGQQSLKAFAKTAKVGHILEDSDVNGCLKYFIKRLQSYFKDNFKNFNHNINL